MGYRVKHGKDLLNGHSLERFRNDDCKDMSRDELIDRLFDARIAKLKYKHDRYSRGVRALKHDGVVAGLDEQNRAIARVLELNGIHPYRLAITYKETYCHYCSKDEDDRCWLFGVGCKTCEDYIEETFTEILSFYDFDIGLNKIKGIDERFNLKEMKAIKVVDLSTGAVLWESEGE